MEQLEWESRNGRLVAIAAFASALLVGGGLIWGQAIIAGANDSVESLVNVHKHESAVVAASIVQALGTLLLAPVLAYLFTATRYRRSELPRIALPLAIAAPVLSAILVIVAQVTIIHAARNLAPELPLPPKLASDRADHFLKPVQHVAIFGYIAGLGMAGAFILVSLNAMRAGLLSRFMGILGIIAGALYVLPFLGGPAIIEFFWLLALGVLFLDRWPGGRGPAWDAGEAIPWPSAAEQRAAAQPAPEPEPVAAAPAHPSSKKRKRKRRH